MVGELPFSVTLGVGQLMVPAEEAVAPGTVVLDVTLAVARAVQLLVGLVTTTE